MGKPKTGFRELDMGISFLKIEKRRHPIDRQRG
jgi:hypothetical protein